jgi:acetyl-CoA decarbonylase/synthase complex subunit gamma
MYTDPQKPMKMEPKIYPVNGADENSIVAITVDFALSYFVINGELERSGVPVNLVVCDAGGYSVLTSWAAGKFSAGTISKFFKEAGIEDKGRAATSLSPARSLCLRANLRRTCPAGRSWWAPTRLSGSSSGSKILRVKR